MASAGQAQAHSSQPMHFSSPSGHRLSWCRPWNRGAVGSCTSGYWTVSTFLNICRKVTPKPLIESRKSGTGNLLCGVVSGDAGQHLAALGAEADSVVVRQVQRRGGERGGRGRDCPVGLIQLGFLGFTGSAPLGPLAGGVPAQEQ